MPPLQAALQGARQIGFTVVSITASLIAAFIPLLLMDGVVGRMFREFSATLAIAVALSGLVSLTVTPMLAAHLARHAPRPPGRFARGVDAAMAGLTRGYLWTLRQCCGSAAHGGRHHRPGGADGLALPGDPEGLHPGAGHRPPHRHHPAAADTSFQAMLPTAGTGGRRAAARPGGRRHRLTVGGGNGNASVSYRQDLHQPEAAGGAGQVTAAQVIDRLRRAARPLPGHPGLLRAVQDVSIGGRAGSAHFQFVLLSPIWSGLGNWSERWSSRLRRVPGLTDVSSDQQRAGPGYPADIDRDRRGAARGQHAAVTAALNNSFAQRQVSDHLPQPQPVPGGAGDRAGPAAIPRAGGRHPPQRRRWDPGAALEPRPARRPRRRCR